MEASEEFRAEVWLAGPEPASPPEERPGTGASRSTSLPACPGKEEGRERGGVKA